MSAAARAVLGAGPLLLDFDGPVCSIFAGYPAPHVAAELVAQLRAADVGVPDAVARDVTRWRCCGGPAPHAAQN